MSELVSQSGVPLASVKYYLREGVLMPGVSTGATQAHYGEEHVRRLKLIRALTVVAGLSVQKTREVLAIIDTPEADLFESLGRAVAALPPYTEGVGDFPRAKWALERLGQLYEPRYAAVAQLERALEAAEEAGLPLSEERLLVYGRHIMAIAEADLNDVPDDPSRAIEYAVLGTAMYEPVLAALRRLAHQDLASRRLAASR
ncbi:MerR family transcriptional regulator [Lysobacter korlensis]|uniref:MerR family transcriptional regulator n=1 Tax=Lysobacter korlensis TaxID=553636 RepID=A0ABV6RY98_9GAMM